MKAAVGFSAQRECWNQQPPHRQVVERALGGRL